MTETPHRTGRPRVGDAARTLPPTDSRGARTASKQSFIRLAAGQPAEVQEIADHLAMSGSAFIRRSIRKLLDGQIRPPRSNRTVPDGGTDQDGGRTLVIPADDIAALVRLGEDIEAKKEGTLITPSASRGPWRPGSRDTGLRDALIRYAVAQDVKSERERGA